MTWMHSEILEQPHVVAKIFDRESSRAAAIGERLRSKSFRSCVFVARGSSDHAAIFGRYLVESFCGIPTALAAPSIATLYRRGVDLSGSVAIGVSQSGRSADVVEYLRRARRWGAWALAVTNDPHSPLAEAAQDVLLCHAGVERSVAATKTFTAQLACLYLLASAWAGGSIQKRLLRAFADVPRLLRAALRCEQRIAEAARRIGDADRCVVLARGFSFPIALETALKMQEAAGMPAQGASAADFLHGPVAGVGEGDCVLALAPAGPGLPSLRRAAARIRRAGAELVAFGSDAALLRLADNRVRLAAGPEPVSALPMAVCGQLVAYHLARFKGANPDRPRGLRKVTKTW